MQVADQAELEVFLQANPDIKGVIAGNTPWRWAHRPR